MTSKVNVQMDGEKGSSGQEEATSPILRDTGKRRWDRGPASSDGIKENTVEQSSTVPGREAGTELAGLCGSFIGAMSSHAAAT